MGKSIECLKKKIKTEPFSNHIGITLRNIRPGYAIVEARFSEKMNSFHGLTYGGTMSPLIDAATGAAANSHGTIAFAFNMSITYIEPPEKNALLFAEAKEESRTKRTATYHIEVIQKNGNETKRIANCQALAYRQGNSLPFLNHSNNERCNGEGQAGRGWKFKQIHFI
jgi:acyl-CoA thioesterase